jgi:hypothetical protein
MNELPKYIFRFVALVLLQVLVLDNIQLGGYINPFPYIYFILILPINTGRLTLLFFGFLLGITLDVFSATGGIHAAACTLIAFYRPFLLKAQGPRDGFELHATPHARLFGVGWFFGLHRAYGCNPSFRVVFCRDIPLCRFLPHHFQDNCKWFPLCWHHHAV